MNKKEIRKKAEEMLDRIESRPGPAAEKMTAEEIIHELRVHQIELQLQNEELQETQQQLLASRNKYHNLFNLAPVGYFSLDEANLIIEVNRAGREMLGSQSGLENKPFLLFIPQEEQSNFMEFKEEILAREQKISREIKIRRRNGSHFYAYLTGIPAFEEGKGQLYLALINIEERKKKEAKLKYANQALESTYKKYRRQIDKAREMHTRFFPESIVEIGNINISSFYNPADNLGGDFYNIIRTENRVIFYIVDISGHGFDGAILNVFIRELINSFLLIEEIKDNELFPPAIIEFVARKFRQESFPASYYICILVGMLDLTENKVYYSNAGVQIPPLFVKEEGVLEELKTAGLPISAHIDEQNYRKENLTVSQVDLRPGSILFFATDGLVEEENNGEMFGLERVKRILADNYYLPSGVIIDRIKRKFAEITGSRQSEDDITLFMIEHQHNPRNRLRKTVASNYRGLNNIKEEMKEFISGLNLDRDLLMIGFHEMMVNAIEHGNKNSPEKKVKVNTELHPDYMRIVIEDEGSGFNWKDYLLQDPEISEENIDRERGFGIIMTRKAYDHVYYNEKGNRATLVKLLLE